MPQRKRKKVPDDEHTRLAIRVEGYEANVGAEATFLAKTDVWREKYLNAGALAGIAIVRKGAVSSQERALVTFPNGETRRMLLGQSADIDKAVIEVFAQNFLRDPDVIALSENGNKVVARDDDLAKAFGLTIRQIRAFGISYSSISGRLTHC